MKKAERGALLDVIVDNLINQAIKLNENKSIIFPKKFWVDYEKDLKVVRVRQQLKDAINEVLTGGGIPYEINDYGITVTIDFDKIALTQTQCDALQLSKLLKR